MLLIPWQKWNYQMHPEDYTVGFFGRIRPRTPIEDAFFCGAINYDYLYSSGVDMLRYNSCPYCGGGYKFSAVIYSRRFPYVIPPPPGGRNLNKTVNCLFRFIYICHSVCLSCGGQPPFGAIFDEDKAEELVSLLLSSYSSGYDFYHLDTPIIMGHDMRYAVKEGLQSIALFDKSVIHLGTPRPTEAKFPDLWLSGDFKKVWAARE